jgi:hypothetical protein
MQVVSRNRLLLLRGGHDECALISVPTASFQMSLLCVLICISGLIALLRRRRSSQAGAGGHQDSGGHVGVGGGYAVQNRHFNVSTVHSRVARRAN